ncbi:hypothetical protein [Saccharolobus islandicus]|uniref:hypothetical protein n=1 Tax=Saccharolobus islandicus TaxID=43080 RepID=UPI00064F352E|nr:hypothetical protein [Sulfolobus islandicus]
MHESIKAKLKSSAVLPAFKTSYIRLYFIVFFIIAATGAKRELNLVLVIGAVGLSVLRTLIRFEPNSPQDILDKMHY